MTANQKPRSSSLILVLLLGFLSSFTVLALPLIPGNFNHSRYPTIRGESLTYRGLDTSTFDKRASSTCSDLSIDQAKQMPGWAKLEKYAKDTWGDGGWNIVTNPKEYSDRWASSCVDNSSPVKIVPNGKPECRTQTISLGGTTTGTTGSSTISVTMGESTSGSWTVTKTSMFSTSAELSASFEIPGIFDASASLSTTASFTNSRSDSFTTTKNSEVKQEKTINDKDGSKCSVTLDVKSCNQKGNGKIRIVATGFVWFNYDDSRAPKSDPKGDKHFKYAARIDDVLSLDERTSWMEFEGLLSGQSRGNYKSSCTPIRGTAGGKKKAVINKDKPKDKKPGAAPVNKPTPKKKPTSAPAKGAAQPKKPAGKKTRREW